MTTAPVSEPPMYSSDSEYDDLTVIKGIGPARQRWLKEALNVHTFQDLAALSADDIENRLKAEGQVASRSDIERWLGQAEALAAAAEAETGGEINALANADEAFPSGVEAVNSETGREDLPQTGEGEWKPFASFVVEFQTRQLTGRTEDQRTKVHYMEADKGESWPGLEREQLCQWMRDQLARKELAETEERSLPEVKSAATFPTMVEITQIQAFQPPQVEMPLGLGRAGQPLSGIVRGNKPFALEVSFGLVGTAAAGLVKKHTSYQARFHVRSMSIGAKLHLGDTQPQSLIESKLAYTAVLSQTTLPADVYRLQALVTFQDASIGPGYLEIPMLRVV